MSQNAENCQTLFCGNTLGDEIEYLAKTVNEGEIRAWNHPSVWEKEFRKVPENIYRELDELETWEIFFCFQFPNET